MTGFANAAGLSVVLVVKEIASGVNDTRLKLSALLKDSSWGTLVVEHKDRLSRVDFGWFGFGWVGFGWGCRGAGSGRGVRHRR